MWESCETLISNVCSGASLQANAICHEWPSSSNGSSLRFSNRSRGLGPPGLHRVQRTNDSTYGAFGAGQAISNRSRYTRFLAVHDEFKRRWHRIPNAPTSGEQLCGRPSIIQLCSCGYANEASFHLLSCEGTPAIAANAANARPKQLDLPASPAYSSDANADAGLEEDGGEAAH